MFSLYKFFRHFMDKKNVKYNISACVVVCNEEEVITRCLESIKEVVDEINILHDGPCSDKTIEIARRYTDNIYMMEKKGSAQPHRAYSYEISAGPWILQIDADEFLSVEAIDDLRQLTKNDRVSAYELLWPLWDGQKRLSSQWPYKLCLFKKDDISYIGLPHFKPLVKGRVERQGVVLEHRPRYNNFSREKFFEKWLSWARLHARSYLKDFSQIPKFNYSGNDWPSKMALRRRFPLLLIPFEFLITFIKDVRVLPLRHLLISLKVAFMYACYRVAVNYYVFKYKNIDRFSLKSEDRS